jgi:hypothetical protein
MSPAVAARGKIRRAQRRGETIPLGYALDADGRATTDPTAALGGVVLPIGTYKGSGISMMMDIFGGVISGAAFAGQVGDQYKAYDRPQDVGHFFLAMKPNLFISEGASRRRVSRRNTAGPESPIARTTSRRSTLKPKRPRCSGCQCRTGRSHRSRSCTSKAIISTSSCRISWHAVQRPRDIVQVEGVTLTIKKDNRKCRS